MTSDFDPNRTDNLYANDTTSTDDTDERVEQLAAEIDETRGDLTETIQAIGEKLEPSNIAREASETVKATTLGKVEQMSYGAQETWRDVKSGNTGNIVDTIKSNPVPAGMVGLGLAILFMNRGQQGQNRQSSYESYDYGSSLPGDHGYTRQSSWEPQQWDRRSSNGGQNPLEKVGSTVSGVAGSAGDTVGQVADQAGQKVGQVADTVGQAAGSVGQAASELPQQAGYFVQQGGNQVRRFIDENPLGAGVIAVAAGAALGMLLPTTRMERETIGQARDQLVAQAETTVHQALDKVEEQTQQ